MEGTAGAGDRTTRARATGPSALTAAVKRATSRAWWPERTRSTSGLEEMSVEDPSAGHLATAMTMLNGPTLEGNKDVIPKIYNT